MRTQPRDPIAARLSSGHSAPWMGWFKGHSVPADNPPPLPFGTTPPSSLFPAPCNHPGCSFLPAEAAHAPWTSLLQPSVLRPHGARRADAADGAALPSSMKPPSDFLSRCRITTSVQTRSLVNNQHSLSITPSSRCLSSSHPAPQAGKCHRWPVPACRKHSQCR